MTKPLELTPVYSIVNVDTQANPAAYLATLVSSGAKLLQIRWKNSSPTDISGLVHFALHLPVPNSNSPVIIINDSVELCRATGAHGVHLGQTDLRPEKAREMLGPEAIIGYSTHSLQQVADAPTDALDYIALGPIYLSPTKSGHADPVGLDILATACKTCPLPIVAIGGITEANVGSVYRAGARSVALISALESTTNTTSLFAKFNSQYALAQTFRK